MEMLAHAVAAANSGDPVKQLEAAQTLRKLLAIERTQHIQLVIDSGVVPKLVEFLSCHDSFELQYEAAWALTNMVCGSSPQTRYVIELGAVPFLKNLMLSPNEKVREQAIMAIGNIGGDSPSCRDFVLWNNVMEPILHNLAAGTSTSLVRNSMWALSNLCRGKPVPKWEAISICIPTLAKYIYINDEETLTDACWALSYLSENNNQVIQAFLQTNILQRLIELLVNPSYSVQTPVIRTLQTLTSFDFIKPLTINFNILPVLLMLLSSPKKRIRLDVCSIIANLVTFNVNAVQAVIDVNIVPRLIALATNSEIDVKKKAAEALSNAIVRASPEQISYMVNSDILNPLCGLLACNDHTILLTVLRTLSVVLKYGKDSGTLRNICEAIEQNMGLDRLEMLQCHDNSDVYELSTTLLEYFSTEEELDEFNQQQDQYLCFDINHTTNELSQHLNRFHF